jgi:hypothetical protein
MAYKATLLLFFWLLPFTPSSHSHPFYVGVTELNVLPGALEVSTRLFTDDLEAALDAYGKRKGIDLIRYQPAAAIESLLPAYLAEKMEVRANNNKLSFEYIGYEVEADACWIHLEAKLKPSVQQLSIDVRFLYELFPSQQHIIHLMQGEARKSKRLEKGDQSWVVQLPL